MKTMSLLPLALCVLAACTKQTPSTPPTGTETTTAAASRAGGATNAELKIGISQEFENLNPLIMSMVATTYMHGLVGRQLDVMDAKARWIPQIVKEIPSLEKGTAKIVDVGGKKKIISNWEILENAKWGDGTPVTCADIAFSREIAISPTVSVPEKQTYADLEKVEWDPKTPKKCVFTHEKAKWDFYTFGTFYLVPKHLEEPIWKKYGKAREGYEKNSNYTKNPTNPGLYNGPYVISDVKLGDHVTFTPNPHFYGEKPKIQKIIVKVIPNTATMEANLRSGTIDMISNLGITLDQALVLEKKAKAENAPFEVKYQPSLTYEHIDLNLDNPILKDVRVRRALLHAVNREDLVKALFEGKQPVAQHFINPIDPWYTADPKYVTTYRYSKREAQKILDEAGWKVGDDGYRVKDGKKLSLVFQTTADNKSRELVQTYLQEQWKAVGVEIVIKNEPARVFFGDTMTKRKFGALAMYAWVSSPENSPRSNLSSKSIPASKNGYSGQNFPGYARPEMDQAIENLDTEFDAKKRSEIAWNIQKMYMDDLPVLPLYYRVDISVVPKNLGGYQMPGHQFYETNFAENWDLK